MQITIAEEANRQICFKCYAHRNGRRCTESGADVLEHARRGNCPLRKFMPIAEKNGETIKVISFSLFGHAAKYLRGAAENVSLAAKHYPGWVCRFYVDDSISGNLKQALIEGSAQIVKMPLSQGLEGTFWRFLVAADPDVRRWICRDVDARISRREALAVAEWIESGLKFHVMRDELQKTWSAKIPIQAGMWGGLGMSIPNIASLIAGYQPRRNYNDDEKFLTSIIWPFAKSEILKHSSYVSTSSGNERPFPSPRVGNEWVGKTVH